MEQKAKHTAAGIPTWSPTVVLICRSTAYVWQSGRDAQFSADCGRMCLLSYPVEIYSFVLLCDSLLQKSPLQQELHSSCVQEQIVVLYHPLLVLESRRYSVPGQALLSRLCKWKSTTLVKPMSS